jgi:hypothetical protein
LEDGLAKTGVAGELRSPDKLKHVLRNRITQSPDSIDSDGDFVTGGERKGIGRNDARAGK